MRSHEKMSVARTVVRATLLAAALATACVARGAERDPGEIRGLTLGQRAADMSVEGFQDFACGANGANPRQALDDWRDFLRCPPEPGGLHEVAVRFDDADDYVGRAIDDPTYARSKGTRVAGHPVLLSVLFDDAGVVRVIRMITDPREDPAARRMAYLLRLAAMDRYGPEGWACEDFPPAAGETPVGGVFVKTRCVKRTEAKVIVAEARFLRKPGQSDIDPVTRDYRPGQYESSTRLEIFDPAFAPK
jgi:hypothetical protein